MIRFQLSNTLIALVSEKNKSVKRDLKGKNKERDLNPYPQDFGNLTGSRPLKN